MGLVDEVSSREQLLKAARRLIDNGKRPHGEISSAKGKTPVLTAGEARTLLDSISIRKTTDQNGDVYQVPIHQELRGQADEFDIRIEVTLSYVAQPRRTRRAFASLPVNLG